ncbi:MAG TPA: hypothetical protein VMY43_12385 [Methanothrix sp.]|nr:hypothetical protein [Methanothrix sp.]
MGFKCVVIALAFVACLCMTAFAQGPKNEIVEPEFPGEDMSGSQIYEEVREGVYDNPNDAALSFRNESLFLIRKDTGMSPHVPDNGVRTPVTVVKGLGVAPAAGSWALTLNDVGKSYLKLNLYQTADAVFGSGELAVNGVVTAVTAGGSVLGDRLALFVIPAGSQNMYRFSLTIKPGSMSGEYIFTAPGITQPGVAFGSLLSLQSSVAPALQTAQTQQTTQVQQTAQAQQVTQVLPVTAPTTV